MLEKNNVRAFTLVELIMVTSILAILSTMGMVYFFGQVRDSRDVLRVTDLQNMSHVLELHFIKNARYPVPDNSTEVTYDDATIWHQGVYGDATYKLIKKLDKKPLDPSTGTEYSYSLLSNKKEFELSTIFEGELISYIPGVSVAHAAEKSAYTLGNYNKKFSVVKDNENTTILALPSITSSTLENTDVESIIQNNDMVIHGGYNLPANYNEILDPQSGGVNNVIANLVVYTGSLDSLSTLESKKIFIQHLQDTYINSTVASGLEKGQYESLLKIDINNSLQVENYIANLSRKNTGGLQGVR